MLDIKFIRDNIDLVKQTVKNKQSFSSSKRANVDVDKLLELDRQHLEMLQKVEDLRKQRNEAAGARDIEKGKAVKEELEKIEGGLVDIHNKLVAMLILVPNLSSDDTPIGEDESANQVLRKWGEP